MMTPVFPVRLTSLLIQLLEIDVATLHRALQEPLHRQAALSMLVQVWCILRKTLGKAQMVRHSTRVVQPAN